RPPPSSTLFPYTTLFRSLYTYFGSKRELFLELVSARTMAATARVLTDVPEIDATTDPRAALRAVLKFQLKTVLTPVLLRVRRLRSEEHTSELQSRENLVC